MLVQQIEREVFNKEKVSNIMFGKKARFMRGGKTAMASFRILLERRFVCVQENLSRVMFRIAPIIAEETESSKTPNVIRGFSDVIFILYRCEKVS